MFGLTALKAQWSTRKLRINVRPLNAAEQQAIDSLTERIINRALTYWSIDEVTGNFVAQAEGDNRWAFESPLSKEWQNALYMERLEAEIRNRQYARFYAQITRK